MFILIDAKKGCEKIEYPFMSKRLQQIRYRRNEPQLNKGHM